MLQISALSHTYTGQQPIHFPDFALGFGESMWVKGQSGAGKSTLFHLIMGMLSPSQGEIRLEDKVWNQNFKGNDIRRSIGFVPQRPLFVNSLTIQENIYLGKMAGIKLEKELVIRELSEQLSVADCLHKFPTELSLGQLQRAQVLRALSYPYRVLLLDEPTASLDDESALKVKQVLTREGNEESRALLVISHDPRLESWKFTKEYQL